MAENHPLQTFVRDQLARAPDRRRTQFRLTSGETAAGGLRRIVGGQIELATHALESGDDVGGSVHEARKSFKRMRAAVRLSRDAVGDEVYRRENHAYRDTGRELSGARDAQVLRETLGDLADRYRKEIPEDAFAGLLGALAADAEAAHARLERDTGAVDEVRAALDSAHDRIAGWPLPERAGAGVLAPGFARIYKRGRRALRAAEHEHSDESMHELRKRAKDLWHSAQILRPVSKKHMKRLGRRAHRLSDLLGDDHDLAVLLEAAGTRPQTLRPGELALLQGLIARRRRRLQREALACARRIYKRKPSAWRKRIAKGAPAVA